MGGEFKHCSIEGCNNNSHYKSGGSGGLCRTHYKRKLRHGDPCYSHVRHSAAMQWIRDHVNYGSDECLLWPFVRNKQGYGELSSSNFSRLAHRVMCMLAHGKPELSGLDAAHSCGNGHLGCVNPRHLRWDTRSGNCSDKLAHGTDNRGTKNPIAKLTYADVMEIKNLRGKMTQRSIAAMFGIDQSNVCKIQKNVSWSYKD